MRKIIFFPALLTACCFSPCLPAQSGTGELKIAYNVLHDADADDYEVFVMNPDGSGKKNISNWKGVDWVYYAHGDKIYYISDRDTCHRCYFLYEMDANGDHKRRIADFRLRDSWVSSRNNGTELIVHPHPKVDSAFRIIDLRGRVLGRLHTGLAYAADPCFSPDGTQVVFRGSRQPFKKDAGYLDELFLIGADGSGLRQLTAYPAGDTTASWWNYHAGPPIWDANTNTITYHSVQNGKSAIYRISPAGGEYRRVSRSEVSEDWHAWSPDGRFMVFSGAQAGERKSGDNYDIYLFDKTENTTRRLTTDTIFEQAPVFVKRKTEIPQWVLDDWALRCSGTGRWIADNAAYKSEQEPFDAYGLHWQYGPGQKSMKGRLYGLADGREVATFWEFLMCWDASEQQVRVVQTGADGTSGHGMLIRLDDGAQKMQQRFSSPGGAEFNSGHLEKHRDGVIDSQSFDIVSGKWEKRRHYIWKKK